MPDEINLSRLPPLDIVHDVDYEAIVQDIVQRAGLENPSPSDPAFRIALACAYREMLLRQDANEQAQSVMLAFAKGPQLDHLAHTYYKQPNGECVQRYESESDEQYRERLQRSPEGLSVAGPEDAYSYHARAAHTDIKDVSVTSPEPVCVVVRLLSRIGNGEPTSYLIEQIRDYLESRRPLTDKLHLLPAEIYAYAIQASIFLKSGPDPCLIERAAQTSLERYVASQHVLGGRVVLSGIHAALMVTGVDEVQVSEWDDIYCEEYQAPYCEHIKLHIVSDV